jgi:hypothetical protein
MCLTKYNGNPKRGGQSPIWAVEPYDDDDQSRGSSVSIVSDYVLDDQAIGVRSPAEEEDFFSSLCV